MADTRIRPGDELDATVVAAPPFGLLVRAGSGVPGLVRGARADVGASVRVRVVEFDETEQRFSAVAV